MARSLAWLESGQKYTEAFEGVVAVLSAQLDDSFEVVAFERVDDSVVIFCHDALRFR
jgi:hypothetical protein